jgi:hypothetical protein
LSLGQPGAEDCADRSVAVRCRQGSRAGGNRRAPPYRWVIEEPGGCGADTDHQPERADWSKCELAFDIADVVEVERQSQQGDTIIARQHH